MFYLFRLCRKDKISFDIVAETGNIVAKNGNNVEATFDIVERIVQLVAFDNVAWTLLLVWTRLYDVDDDNDDNDRLMIVSDSFANVAILYNSSTADKRYPVLISFWAPWSRSNQNNIIVFPYLAPFLRYSEILVENRRF